VRLFDRSTRRVSLTPIGERLLLATEKMVAAEYTAEEILGGTDGLDRGEIRLGADRPGIAIELMTSFSAQQPAIRMSFRVGNSTELEKGVEDQQLDAAIIGRPVSSSRLRSKFLIDEPNFVIVSKRHAIACRKSVTFRKLSEHAMIVRERGSRLRKMIDEKLLELDNPTAHFIEVNDWQSAREFAARNMGCAIVPESELVSDQRLVVLKLLGAMESLPAYLGYRIEQLNHRVVGTFIKMTDTD
jgi:DNA-binding transcriptional LysR family regulator